MTKTRSIIASTAAVLVALTLAGATIAAGSIPKPVATHAAVARVTVATPIPTFTAEPAPMRRTIRIAAYGDSITAWNGTTPIVGGTWAQDLNVGPVVVDYADGFAHGGYTLAQIEANAHAPLVTTDYVVVMAGINSVGPKTLNPASQWGVSMYDMTVQLRGLIAALGIPSNRIILTSIAPDAALLAPSNAWNAQEAALCSQTGCHYIDPYAGLRSASGAAYAPALTMDGIHPNAAGSLILANSIAASVEKIAG